MDRDEAETLVAGIGGVVLGMVDSSDDDQGDDVADAVAAGVTAGADAVVTGVELATDIADAEPVVVEVAPPPAPMDVAKAEAVVIAAAADADVKRIEAQTEGTVAEIAVAAELTGQATDFTEDTPPKDRENGHWLNRPLFGKSNK